MGKWQEPAEIQHQVIFCNEFQKAHFTTVHGVSVRSQFLDHILPGKFTMRLRFVSCEKQTRLLKDLSHARNSGDLVIAFKISINATIPVIQKIVITGLSSRKNKGP